MSNVISEKQQKNTIRGKKGKKGTVKNVLASPYTHYWPLIKNEDDNNLKQILKNNLPKIKEQKKNIPWKEIKHIPKDERKAYRSTKLNLHTNPIDSSSKYMYFGINEVTKLLENDEAISVLLSNDVTPQLMIKHVVDLCVFKRVPVLVVPNLKEFLGETVGIRSVAIAFKDNHRCDSKLVSVHKTIDNIFISYPIPENHAAYNITESNFFNALSTETIIDDKTKIDLPIENVYLYRGASKSGRVFVPENSNKRKEITVDKVETHFTSDFLSFNDNIDDSLKTCLYNSLVVKQIKGNPNRNKRKLDMIKNKKK